MEELRIEYVEEQGLQIQSSMEKERTEQNRGEEKRRVEMNTVYGKSFSEKTRGNYVFSRGV